jgi:hypothetical protein
MADDSLHAADQRLEEARRDVELRLGELRTAIEDELGWVPRRKQWLVAVLAGAAGLALALRRRKRKRRLGSGRAGR